MKQILTQDIIDLTQLKLNKAIVFLNYFADRHDNDIKEIIDILQDKVILEYLAGTRNTRRIDVITHELKLCNVNAYYFCNRYLHIQKYGRFTTTLSESDFNANPIARNLLLNFLLNPLLPIKVLIKGKIYIMRNTFYHLRLT